VVPTRVDGGQPVRPDDRNQDAALLHGLAQTVDEIHARFDGVDIHEDLLFAEASLQPIVETSSVAGAVITAIADKDSTRHGLRILR
jgi:hypothetical protein